MKSRRPGPGCPAGSASLTSHGHRPGSEEVSQPAGRGDHHTDVKKSVASTPPAYTRRNWDQVGPERRGAGPSPAAFRIRLIVVAPTRTPSLRSSPLIRGYPPSGVLPSQSHDEGPNLRLDWWSAGPAPRIGPLPPDELAVPTEEGLGRHDERRPALSGQGSGKCSEYRAVERAEPGSPDLPAEDLQLPAEDHDLDVRGPIAPRKLPGRKASKDGEGEPSEHGRRIVPMRCSEGVSKFWHPSRSSRALHVVEVGRSDAPAVSHRN